MHHARSYSRTTTMAAQHQAPRNRSDPSVRWAIRRPGGMAKDFHRRSSASQCRMYRRFYSIKRRCGHLQDARCCYWSQHLPNGGLCWCGRDHACEVSGNEDCSSDDINRSTLSLCPEGPTAGRQRHLAIRFVGSAVETTIYFNIYDNKVNVLPQYFIEHATKAGLPKSSGMQFAKIYTKGLAAGEVNLPCSKASKE